MIEGDDVPKICARCAESYWEEMCGGWEAPFCGEYNKICDDALKECKRIEFIPKCDHCPRNPSRKLPWEE
jgi:hypothetical protein